MALRAETPTVPVDWETLREVGLMLGIDIDTQEGMNRVVGAALERGIDFLPSGNYDERVRESTERSTMPKPDDVLRATGHVIDLLNQVEATLTGWVIGYDREEVAKLTGPLYDLADTDTPPSMKGGE
jgi:hypothetical protein